MSAWLVDTGPLVAFIDESDEHHERVLPVFHAPRAALWTSAAVITEAMLLLQESPKACLALIELLRKTKIRIDPLLSLDDLNPCVAAMTRFHNVPMDFADASLVVLADKIKVYDVLTTDERGFRVFRTARNKWFHLVLDDFPG